MKPNKEKTAKQMFKELGYKFYEDLNNIGEKLFVYEWVDDYKYLRNPPKIKFNLANDIIHMECFIKSSQRTEVFEAINKQCEELGWDNSDE